VFPGCLDVSVRGCLDVPGRGAFTVATPPPIPTFVLLISLLLLLLLLLPNASRDSSSSLRELLLTLALLMLLRPYNSGCKRPVSPIASWAEVFTTIAVPFWVGVALFAFRISNASEGNKNHLNFPHLSPKNLL
jgi:hypothetical protein